MKEVPRCACFVLCLIGVEAEGLLDYQGRASIISILPWNLRTLIYTRCRCLAHRNRSDVLAICDCDADCGPQKSLAISGTSHCNLRVRWKVASDLRFRVAMSEPETPSFCGICGDLAPPTRKSLVIAIVRFWCAKMQVSLETGKYRCRKVLRRRPRNVTSEQAS